MCYQCSGCGRCLEKERVGKATALCPCCHREVPATEKECPFCGMFIRPRAGSRAVKRPAAPSAEAGRARADGGQAPFDQGNVQGKG